MDVDREKIVSLAREYVENTKCSCSHPGRAGCWHCLFEYNLRFVDAGKPLNKEMQQSGKPVDD